MRVLFGIISCNENEYEQCILSAKAQINIELEIYEVKNKKKKESHDELYSYFMNSKESFDYFVKLDGDMVLRSKDIIYNLCERLNSRKEFKSLEVSVFDHFTNRNIWGLHVYRNSYTWDIGNELHFTDKIDSKNQLKLLINDPADPLVPAADHCPNPSEYQCFHFGVHKATKVLQYGRKTWDLRGARSHFLNYNKLFNRLKNEPDNSCLIMTVKGFHWAIRNGAKPDFANYSNNEAQAGFMECKLLKRLNKITFIAIIIKRLKLKYF